MSYPQLEDSVDSGKPLYFYEFIYGDAATNAYRYVAALDLTVYGGRPWTPFPIKHSEIVTSGSLDKQTLTVTAREDIDITGLVVTRAPSRVTTLNIYRGHAGDDDLRMIWSGRVLSGNMIESSEVELACESISTSQLNIGLRRKYQRGCPHALYGRACSADKSLHSESGSSTSVANSMTVSVTLTSEDRGLTEATLTGGIFRITLKNGLTEIRAITSAVNNGGRNWTLNIIAPISDMTAGRPVSVSKGCLHTFDACKNVFNNADNYGGCANIPTKNPFNANQF